MSKVRKCIKFDLSQQFDQIQFLIREVERHIFQERPGFAAGAITNIEQTLNAVEFFMTDAEKGEYNVRGYRKVLAGLKGSYRKQFKKEVA